MGVFTAVLELLGLGLIVAGVAFVFWPAALVVSGAGLLWVARGLSRRGTV